MIPYKTGDKIYHHHTEKDYTKWVINNITTEGFYNLTLISPTNDNISHQTLTYDGLVTGGYYHSMLDSCQHYNLNKGKKNKIYISNLILFSNNLTVKDIINDKFLTVKSVDSLGKFITFTNASIYKFNEIDRLLPVLRPFSSLTKSIHVDGYNDNKSFIPIEKIMEILEKDAYSMKKIIDVLEYNNPYKFFNEFGSWEIAKVIELLIIWKINYNNWECFDYYELLDNLYACKLTNISELNNELFELCYPYYNFNIINNINLIDSLRNLYDSLGEKMNSVISWEAYLVNYLYSDRHSVLHGDDRILELLDILYRYYSNHKKL